MKLLMPAVVCAALFCVNAVAEEPAVKEKISVQSNVVQLADGGSIILASDGKTYHQDANGKRVRMKDGVVMEGKDGKKYLHKNDAIWQQIVTKGTMGPNR